jgi:hypothetical protein
MSISISGVHAGRGMLQAEAGVKRRPHPCQPIISICIPMDPLCHDPCPRANHFRGGGDFFATIDFLIAFQIVYTIFQAPSNLERGRAGVVSARQAGRQAAGNPPSMILQIRWTEKL